jgi:indole-3-glycerol phosphate synthase
METFGVPFFALNISVGLSVKIAGFGSDVAAGLLGELPFGVLSLVGVKSLAEARAAREAGADSLFIRRELVAEYQGRERQLVQELIDATNGDD